MFCITLVLLALLRTWQLSLWPSPSFLPAGPMCLAALDSALLFRA